MVYNTHGKKDEEALEKALLIALDDLGFAGQRAYQGYNYEMFLKDTPKEGEKEREKEKEKEKEVLPVVHGMHPSLLYNSLSFLLSLWGLTNF